MMIAMATYTIITVLTQQCLFSMGSEAIKQTPLLIERLNTAEIDNLKEFSDTCPSSFREVLNELKQKRYWIDVRIEIALLMCNYLTLNENKVRMDAFQDFFKDPQ